MAKAKKVEKPAAIIPMLRTDIIGTLAIGAVTGLIVWGLGMVFNRFIFDAYLCQGELISQCGDAKNYSAILSGLIGAGAALGGLVRLRIYRPLLVVIASMLSLWGIVQIAWDFGWFTGALVSALLYAVAFGLFSWVARIREFWISIIIIILLVVGVRLALLI